MQQDSYHSVLSSHYTSKEMQEIFSPPFRAKIWRKLWIALAEAEKELGVDISLKQLTELKENVEKVDLEKIKSYEKRMHHEVMAHLHAYADLCPEGGKILHLGASSSYLIDNGDLLQILSALKIIKGKLILLIEHFNHLCLETASLPCLAYIHLQPAFLTTFGKRSSLWLQDFLTDFKDLEHFLTHFRFLGVKGKVGSQDSFLALFEGDAAKVIALDQKVTEKMGCKNSFLITSQTFPRKEDLRLLSVLSAIAASAHKCATDLRLLAHLNEIEEPFGSEQVGFSTMPYKRNPIFSERICSLSRFLINLWNNTAYNSSLQWLERSSDDAANRRLTIPEAFLSLDAILNLMGNLISELKFFPKAMEAHIEEHLPYIALDHILAAATLKGQSHSEVEKRLRLHCFEAGKKQRKKGDPSDLLERIEKDGEIGLSQKELESLMKKEHFLGRSSEQVIEFLKLEVEPILEKNLVFKVLVPSIDL
ncbi:MAG: adenylosuccinate lyase [Simkania negevensis]|nr:adenylosuccinate lyase [Simkania negevensis]